MDDSIAPALVSAWQNYKSESDELFVETVLAAGFVAAVLMFMATTEVEGQVKGVKFRKIAATPELVQAIIKPFLDILAKLGGT